MAREGICMLKCFGDGFGGHDLATFTAALDGLRTEIAFDNLTMYTLGNYRSALPFLPQAGPDPALQQAKFAHAKALGLSTGVMLQLLSHNQESWGAEIVLGGMTPEKIADIEAISKGPVTVTPITADFTHEGYVPRLLAMVDEQLRLFPDLDYIFLEFEGIDFVPRDQLETVYRRWADPLGLPGFADVTYTSDTVDYCRSILTEPSVFFAEEFRAWCRHFHGRNLHAVCDYLREVGFTGTVGVVFHLYGYESRIFPDLLPDPGWWLLPWHYWNPNFEPAGTTAAMIAQKQAVSKASMRRWVAEGKPVCYIGDVALGKGGLDAVRDFYAFTASLDPAGYMGLGLPDLAIGARWIGVEDSDLLAARAVYRELY
jgi:hypothetical protein